MGRRKIYTEEERKERKREAQRRYYRDNKSGYQKRALKYWARMLENAGYTVIPPGGGQLCK